MRKNLIALLAVVFFTFSAYAQNTFNKGDKVINLGIGLGSTLYSGSYYANKFPPVSA